MSACSPRRRAASDARASKGRQRGGKSSLAAPAAKPKARWGPRALWRSLRLRRRPQPSPLASEAFWVTAPPLHLLSPEGLRPCIHFHTIRGFLQRSTSAPVCAAARGCSGSACDASGCTALVFIGVPTYKETCKLWDALFWAFALTSSSRRTAVHSPASLTARQDDFSTSAFWLTSAALTEYTGSSYVNWVHCLTSAARIVQSWRRGQHARREKEGSSKCRDYCFF